MKNQGTYCSNLCALLIFSTLAKDHSLQALLQYQSMGNTPLTPIAITTTTTTTPITPAADNNGNKGELFDL
jgi:hypothetical protein